MRDESSNVERKLEEIISMDYPNENLSLLVVDTGSIDGTKEIATKFLESKNPISHGKFIISINQVNHLQ